MKKINVLFIINSLCLGGAEKQTVFLLNNLDTHKFELSLACLKRIDDLLPQVNKNRLKKIFYCNVKQKVDLQAVKLLAQYIEVQRIDVVLCTNEYPMLYAILAVKNFKKKCKVIEVYHSVNITNFKKYIQMIIYRWFFNKCNCVTFVSKNQENYWLKEKNLKIKKSISIHNGIDYSYYDVIYSNKEKQALIDKLNLGADDYIIGFCSILRPEKKHVDALKAILKLKDRGIDAKLLIIGDGPERNNIELHIKKLGLENNVRITGFQEDVRPFISLCDCMVITSHSETFSIAALEAMAMGKPMIMTNIGGATEQIEHGKNGFIYTPGDVNSLADYMSQLFATSLRKKFGRCARNTVKSKFSLDKMINKYENLLCEIVNS